MDAAQNPTQPAEDWQETENIRLARIEREMRWETEGVAGVAGMAARGKVRAEKFLADAELADTVIGKRIINELLGPMTAAIKAMQANVVEGLAKGGNRANGWLVLCLEPDKLAYITLRASLTFQFQQVVSLSVRIADMVKAQREFDLWKQRQMEREKENRERGVYAVNLYKTMIAYRGNNVNPRVAAHWIKRSGDVDRLPWTKEEKIALGKALINVLVATGGKWFTLEKRTKGTGDRSQTVTEVRLTPEAIQWIDEEQDIVAALRPWLLPMLIQPRDWKLEANG